MPTEIRIYFEGHKSLKPGFHTFFKELREQAYRRRCGFTLVSSKSREEARRDFGDALKANPDAWNLLLIDSEGPHHPKPADSGADSIFLDGRNDGSVVSRR